MLTLPRLTCPQLLLNCPASISSQSLAQDHAWTTKRPPSVAGATRLEVAPVGCMVADLGRGTTHRAPPIIFTSLYLPAPQHENPLKKDCVDPSNRLLRHPSFPSRAALLACPVLSSPPLSITRPSVAAAPAQQQRQAVEAVAWCRGSTFIFPCFTNANIYTVDTLITRQHR
jgi:hypothetical protein